MLKIWGRANSINVQKVMWCVAELDLPHERIDAGMEFGKNDEDWYLAMNPNGKVPVIEDDGTVLWESNSIVRYLAAKHDPGGLYPESPAARALAEQWIDWQLGTLLPPITVVFWGLIRTAPPDRDAGAIAASAIETGRLLGMLDSHLANRAYVAGESLGVADIVLGPFAYRWYGMDVDHPDHPHLRAWYERLAERPAFQDHAMLPIT